MNALRRAWDEYVRGIDPGAAHAVTRPAVLVTTLVVCSLPSLVMAYVPAAQRATGYRHPFLTIGLLGLGLCFSYLMHLASAPRDASRSRIAILNLLDTCFLAAGLAVLAASADHPADCVLAVLPVLIAVVWALQAPFSWPLLTMAALWPAGLTALLAGPHLIRTAIVAWNVPLYAIIALLTGQKARKQRAAQSEARARVAEAERLAAIGRVGASLAHEMNQPLTAIRGYAQRLERAGGEGVERELEAILLASSQLARLVDQVRQMGAPQVVAHEPLDLTTPVADALLLLRSQLEHRGIEVVWSPPPKLPRVSGDRRRLGQLVLNLLVNARDALEGSTAGQARQIRIAAAARDGQVELTVADNGPGVAASLVPRLFEPFVTNKERERGTGLGLAVSREIAEEHAGTLELVPGEGGACFRLRLPALP